MGREVFRQEQNGKEITLELSALRQGAYLISVQNGGYLLSRKFVKM